MTSPRLRRPLLSLAALAALLPLACGDPMGPEDHLASARRRWLASQPAAYRMTLARGCECVTEATTPVVVTVRDGVVTSVVRVVDGMAADEYWRAPIPTVEGLFDLIDGAIGGGAAAIDVSYDPRLGHPVHIAIDHWSTMIDDETTYAVQGFQPL
jgi:hypothetical protein